MGTMEAAGLLKLAGIIFAILFFVNWVCTLSAQQLNGFRWGDYILAVILGMVIFFNMEHIRSLAAVLPDSAAVFVTDTRTRTEDIRAGIRDTRETAGLLSRYLKGVAQREMEYQMDLKLKTPDPALP